MKEHERNEKGQRCDFVAGYIFNVVESYYVLNDTKIAQKIGNALFCILSH